MRTVVYIDGFNLYHRQLEKRPWARWLDLKTLVEKLLPDNNITEIKYYTARVSGFGGNDTPAKQQIYLSALQTVPEISVFYGNFLVSRKWARIVQPIEVKPDMEIAQPWPDVVKIIKVEEKGSDVNLASHLLRDGFMELYDAAAVLSNDSDLVEPLRIVKEEIRKPIGLISPVKNPNPQLLAATSFLKHIRNRHLKDSQFPERLERPGKGDIIRPASWC